MQNQVVREGRERGAINKKKVQFILNLMLEILNTIDWIGDILRCPLRLSPVHHILPHHVLLHCHLHVLHPGYLKVRIN